MKNLDNSLELIYSVLESLIEMSHQYPTLEEKEQFVANIDKLEEARRLLYDARNDFQKLVS